MHLGGAWVGKTKLNTVVDEAMSECIGSDHFFNLQK
jgi:hypothetical protein